MPCLWKMAALSGAPRISELLLRNKVQSNTPLECVALRAVKAGKARYDLAGEVKKWLQQIYLSSMPYSCTAFVSSPTSGLPPGPCHCLVRRHPDYQQQLHAATRASRPEEAKQERIEAVRASIRGRMERDEELPGIGPTERKRKS